MPHIGRNTQPETLINLHFSIGMIVLLVALVRFGWRVTHGEPEPLDGIPPWQTASARVMHWLLYALIVAVPLLGWINASWRGFPVIMFGIELPKLVGTRVQGWGWTGDVHALLANYAMLALVGMHVAAALYHYAVRRDGVLQRMLPGG
jgi:cytochrome b561